MPLINLGHFLIKTENLEETKDFYLKFLGMEDGYRPPFPFPGHWLYIGDTAIVHMANFRANKDEKYYSDQRIGETSTSTGPVDHIAFNATGLDDLRARLGAAGIEFSEKTLPEFGLHQVFVDDPDGVEIEINYPIAEKTG